MQTAADAPRGTIAYPPISVESLEAWEAAKPSILSDFQTHIYGTIPGDLTLTENSRRTIDGTQFDDSAILTIVDFTIRREKTNSSRDFSLVLVAPANSDGTSPYIMMQNFCPNHAVIPHPDIPEPQGDFFSCSDDGMMAGIFTYFFGQYITTPPIKAIMDRGYGLAVMYPTEFVPDSPTRTALIINTMFSDLPPRKRPAAIGAWASQITLVSAWLKQQGIRRTITYGHSRYGKSALVAAAIDPTIDGVISHQSGTGGASLNRDKPGETVKDITAGYPHWFGEAYNDIYENADDIQIDQHHLLALIAPRPILLGNARRDVWSDPNGAFRAAIAATDVYELYGKTGMSAERLSHFKPADEIAFWIRSGTHGVVTEDWPAFLDFMDAHFKS